jgi:hypothetical protein
VPNITCQPIDDSDVCGIADALAAFAEQHPSAEITIRRASLASIHVRIISRDFKSRSRVAREERIWPLLESLPDDTFTQITVLLLLAPQERRDSFANAVYFESPDPAPASV